MRPKQIYQAIISDMANSKKRCKSCKGYYRQSEDDPHFKNWCSDECREVLALNQLAKVRKTRVNREKKENAARKRKFYENDTKTRKESAKKACHAYIRERDKGKQCISCNKPLVGKYDAGHFIPSGSGSYTRFMEKNIHGQCVACNQYRGGMPREYEINLRQRIGDRPVDAILRVRYRKTKRTAQDYKLIEEYYKHKLGELI